MNQENSENLSKYLSPLNVWALSFGCSVGWGAFVMPGTTFLPLAGTFGTVVGLFLGTLAMLIIGMNYHFMMNRCPEAGGTFFYTKKIFGSDHGFLCAWFLVLTYTAIIWANATALSLIARRIFGGFFQTGFHYQFAGFDVYGGEVFVSILALIIFGLICMRLKNFSGSLQTFMAAILFLGILFCAGEVFGAHEGGLESFSPAFVPEVNVGVQIFSMVALAPWAFVGFENISNSAQEFNFSTKKSFGIMFAALVTGFFSYALLSGMAVAILPPEYLNWTQYLADLGNADGLKSLPTFFAVHEVPGDFGLKILGVTVLVSILTGILGNYIASSRLIYSMAREKILPPFFYKVNEQGVPQNAILFLMLSSLAIPFFGRTAISWIIDVLSVGGVIAYGYTSAAAYVEARREKILRVEVTGMIGVILSIFLGFFLLVPNLLSISTMATESYLILVVWSILGFIFFRNLFDHDDEKQFGKSVIVYIVMLFLIFFGSLMWMRQSSSKVMEDSVHNLRNFYTEMMESHGLHRVKFHQEIDDAHVEKVLSNVRSSIFNHSMVQMFLIVVSLAVMFNIYSTMRNRERQADFDKSRAEESNKAKTIFLSNMSHDIRTPMNAIMGFTNLAMGETQNPEKVHEYLTKIQNSGNHLLALINDVLEMSRIESGKMELEENESDLVKIFDDVRDMFTNQMQEKKINFLVETSAVEDRYIFCDASRFNRVLLNLLSNAYKFTPEGGKISVTVRETEKISEELGAYEIRVKDSGIGMTPEFAAKVFEAFERERTSTVSGIQGTGLGMAITKSIVDLMDGNIEVVTAPGAGTEFIVKVKFRLQKNPPQVEENSREDAQKEIDFTGKKVLLVDDVEVNREIAVMILSQVGFEVETAVDGQDAVEKVSAGNYDLVLMDIQMPVMNGYDATKKIRGLVGEKFQTLPIIAMTANAFSEDIQAAKDAGMNDHIAKPLDIPKMMETLGKVLS